MACWAGPMVAAAVRFDYDLLDADVFARLQYLNSSKKVTPSRRAALLPVLLEVADMVAYVAIPAGQIDRNGPDVCNMLALSCAIDAVGVTGSVNLVDGQQRKGVIPRAEWIVRGDETSAAIAAASIVAKEMRDDLMRRLDVAYHGYGFARHKGYGTPEHEAALVKHGPCRAHRRSYLGKVYGRLGVPPPADPDGSQRNIGV
jgi:ribonuclease HII